MTDKEFKNKTEVLNKVLQGACKHYVFVHSSGDNTSVGMSGPLPTLCYMAHELCNSIRKEAEKIVGEKGADKLVRDIVLTDDELLAKSSERLEEEKHRIPKFLRKLMELEDELEEEDDDDSTDETDSEEDEDEDGFLTGLEDDLKRYRFSGHLDFRPDDDRSE